MWAIDGLCEILAGSPIEERFTVFVDFGLFLGFFEISRADRVVIERLLPSVWAQISGQIVGATDLRYEQIITNLDFGAQTTQTRIWLSRYQRIISESPDGLVVTGRSRSQRAFS